MRRKNIYTFWFLLYSCGKHMHDDINLLKREVWDLKTSLSSPLLYWNVCTKPTRESSCIQNLIRTSSFSLFLCGFGTVSTVWYLFAFQRLYYQCFSKTSPPAIKPNKRLIYINEQIVIITSSLQKKRRVINFEKINH
jgi:hypothetical protein